MAFHVAVAEYPDCDVVYRRLSRVVHSGLHRPRLADVGDAFVRELDVELLARGRQGLVPEERGDERGEADECYDEENDDYQEHVEVDEEALGKMMSDDKFLSPSDNRGVK